MELLISGHIQHRLPRRNGGSQTAIVEEFPVKRSTADLGKLTSHGKHFQEFPVDDFWNMAVTTLHGLLLLSAQSDGALIGP